MVAPTLGGGANARRWRQSRREWRYGWRQSRREWRYGWRQSRREWRYGWRQLGFEPAGAKGGWAVAEQMKKRVALALVQDIGYLHLVVHRQPFPLPLMQAFNVRANCVYRHKMIGLRGLHELLRGLHKLLHLRPVLLLLRLW